MNYSAEYWYTQMLCLYVVYGKFKRLCHPHKPPMYLCSLVIFSILIFGFLLTVFKKKKRLVEVIRWKTYKIYYKHNPGHFELLIAVICYRSQVCIRNTKIWRFCDHMWLIYSALRCNQFCRNCDWVSNFVQARA